ncbi:MAG: winged helix-turn-helix transcriptional regulator [Candidatus Eisenbacteria bacterium]|nr:winged helix-turn-helix transcriptional regulator [Candidatus Eisenbacteria bacterium]
MSGEMRELFRALGDPIRYRIVEILREKPCYVSELVERTGAAQPNVSRHLQVLRKSGLLRANREGKWIRYALEPEALRAIGRWSAFPAPPESGPRGRERGFRVEGRRDRDADLFFNR